MMFLSIRNSTNPCVAAWGPATINVNSEKGSISIKRWKNNELASHCIYYYYLSNIIIIILANSDSVTKNRCSCQSRYKNVCERSRSEYKLRCKSQMNKLTVTNEGALFPTKQCIKLRNLR